jgi:hypothetical protein
MLEGLTAARLEGLTTPTLTLVISKVAADEFLIGSLPPVARVQMGFAGLPLVPTEGERLGILRK